MPTSGPRALLGMTYTEKPVEGRMAGGIETRFGTLSKTGLLDRRPKTGVYARVLKPVF